MNVVAILAVRNEELYIGRCCRHLADQGVRFAVIDNDSTDATREIVETFRGHGLVTVIRVPFAGHYDWRGLLACKERLARRIDADWFLHLDADEIPEGPVRGSALLPHLRVVEEAGYNAVNFDEFTFVPTSETERHEGTDYVDGMRRYFFFAPTPQRLIRLWRRAADVRLAVNGGHAAAFAGRRVYPVSFGLRHYMALSMDHLRRKYTVDRTYALAELELGWHGWRARAADLDLRPPPGELMGDASDGDDWDRSRPCSSHPFLA